MRLLTLAAAIALLPDLLGMSPIGSVPVPSSLVRLSSSVARLTESARIGDTASTTRIPAALSLKLHNQAALDKFLADVQNPASPEYHHFVTPAQFNAAYGPTQADVDQALPFLRQAGVSNVEVSTDRQVITFSGTAAQLEKAFHTSIGNYTDTGNGRHFYANDVAPAVPAIVSSVVGNVVGLDNHSVKRHASAAKVSPKDVKAVTPAILKSAYGTGSLPADGAGVTVGFVEFDGYRQNDLATFDSANGLSTGSVNTVPVNGQNYDSNPGDSQLEVDLDVEVVHGIAPKADALVYEAPNTAAGELAMYQKIASDDKAKVVSISWGSCEATEGSSAANSVNSALATGTAEGISYFAAAGDNGTTDCYPDSGSTGKAVNFPASSPNVTGVGGTQLTVTSANDYSSEMTWNDGTADGATGGGVSTLFTAPSWQTTQSTSKRKVPDVAADAAAGSAYHIYSAGSWEDVHGTSGAAPLWAGFTILQNQIHRGSLGNLNSKLYSIGNGSSYTTGFNDVTTGNNTLHGTTGFAADKGYDQVTGWGSFKGAGLSGLIG